MYCNNFFVVLLQTVSLAKVSVTKNILLHTKNATIQERILQLSVAVPMPVVMK